MIRAFIFDVGGVFRDSSECFDAGFRKAFGELGIPFNEPVKDTWQLQGFEEFNGFGNIAKALVCILKSGKSVKEILGLDDPVGYVKKLERKEYSGIIKKAAAIIEGTFYESDSMARVIKGSGEGTRMLFDSGFLMGIACVPKTASTKAWLTKNIGNYFKTVVGGDRWRTKSEGIITACNELGVRPAESVFIGDSITDVRSAKRAGAISAAVLCGQSTEKFLRKENPDFIFRDVLEAARYFCKKQRVG